MSGVTFPITDNCSPCVYPETRASRATKHLAWRVHFTDSEPCVKFYGEPTGIEEVLLLNPDAIAAEPFSWPVSIPDLALSPDEVALLLRWLSEIDAQEDAGMVFNRCASNMILRNHWLEMAHAHFRNKK